MQDLAAGGLAQIGFAERGRARRFQSGDLRAEDLGFDAGRAAEHPIGAHKGLNESGLDGASGTKIVFVLASPSLSRGSGSSPGMTSD
jgi:hypothetical protein